MAVRKLLDFISLPTFINEFLSELVKYLLEKVLIWLVLIGKSNSKLDFAIRL